MLDREISQDATIEDVLPTLSSPEAYIRGCFWLPPQVQIETWQRIRPDRHRGVRTNPLLSRGL